MSRRETLFWTLCFLSFFGLGLYLGWQAAKHLTHTNVTFSNDSDIKLDEDKIDIDPIYQQGGHRWEPEAIFAYEGTVTDA